MMNATQVLAAQHRAIQGLFDEVEQETRRQERARLVSRVAEELIAHMAGEEAVYYPVARRLLPGEEHLADGSRDEHVSLRLQLRRVLATEVDDACFLERVRAFRAVFERHVREEEARLFPRVERALSPSDHVLLGEEIMASRPPIWVITTEGRARAQGEDALLHTRVSLPIPAVGE